MSEVLVEAKGIGKKYRRGMLGGIRLPRLFGRRSRDGADDEFWALKDIDLELREGDSLGIIGPNGAGKSTLLKILSRVTAPTEGVLKVRGRVGALIEVGAGFHQELSGRDNIFINGAILGMSRKEIQRRFDEIVAFAELEDFIDTPVKKYSSGMYVRLGFAVAAHMDPDILLIDEVLAVGDGRFQKKCFEAMARFRAQGRPFVLVSHSMPSVQRNCRNALFLNQGTQMAYGPAEDVIADYQAHIQSRETSDASFHPVDVYEELCTHDIVITDAEIQDNNGVPCQDFDSGDPVRVVIEYEVRQPCTAFHVEVAVIDSYGNQIATNGTYLEDTIVPVQGMTGTVTCLYPRMPLTSGSYTLQIILNDDTACVRYDIWRGFQRPQLQFQVNPNRKSTRMDRWRGIIELESVWTTTSDSVLTTKGNH